MDRERYSYGNVPFGTSAPCYKMHDTDESDVNYSLVSYDAMLAVALIYLRNKTFSMFIKAEKQDTDLKCHVIHILMCHLDMTW